MDAANITNLLTREGILSGLWSDPVVIEVLSSLPDGERRRVEQALVNFVDTWCEGVITPLSAMTGTVK